MQGRSTPSRAASRYSRRMAARAEHEVLTAAGREVAVSNPRKVLFPQAGYTKLDVARYYLAVSEGALRGAGGRPNVLVRYPNGIGGEFFYQKRAPESRPDWVEVVALRFPSGRSAEEVVPRDAATLVWMANLACLELHPHTVRADDLDHPDELRVDLDPVPGVDWPQIRKVASVVRATLADLGLVGWPKTSGNRGMHVCVRIERRWTFDQSGARRLVRPARSNGAHQGWRRASGGRRNDTGCSSTTTRTRRIARWPPLLGAADGRRARVGAARVGRGRRLPARGLHPRHVPPVSRRSATAMPA